MNRRATSTAAPIVIVMLAASAPALAEAQRTIPPPWEVVFESRGAGFHHLWASSPDDIFAAGSAIAHFDGRSWRITPDHAERSVLAISGSGPNEVYAVGADETIQRWDGQPGRSNTSTAPSARSSRCCRKSW